MGGAGKGEANGRRAHGPDTSRPSFLRVFWDNPREPAMVLLGAGIAILWGVEQMLSPERDLAHRALGAIGSVAGATLLVSYTLRFFPGVLADPAWERGRFRRGLRAILGNGWIVFLALVVIAGAVELVRRLTGGS